MCFEGPEYYSTSTPLRGPVLAGQLQKVCEAVVSHISEVTYAQQQISRVVINFKVDSRDKLWMMYSTSIRVQSPNSQNSKQPDQSRKLVNIDSILSIPDTINLNPSKSYDKLNIKRDRIRCISCTKESLDSLRHPITYKSVVKHYEHVLHLVAELAGRNGDKIFNWPPDEEVVEAAGGVGFGCLQLVSEYDGLFQGGKIDMKKPLEQDELKIPPLLRYIHPKLTALNFARCRKDPLFLYKTVTVCESCYLVYAEFMTMVLRLGQDLTKLLKPDPAAVAFIADNSSLARPSSADWRAMSSVNKSSSEASIGFRAGSYEGGSSAYTPSTNHTSAKKKAIGIRSQDIRQKPNVPTAVRKSTSLGVLNTASVDSFGTQVRGSPTQADFTRTQMSLSRGKAMNTGPMSSAEYDQDNIHSIIAEREKVFFREISLNPQLKDQHPLMHLISAQQKLKMVDEQSGVLDSKAGANKKSIFGTEYGHQSKDNFSRYEAYEAEQPCIIAGQSVLLSKIRHDKQVEKVERADKKKRKKLRKLKELRGLNDETSTVDLEDNSDDDPELEKLQSLKNAGAKKHYNFLQNTLKQIEGDATVGRQGGGGDYGHLSPIKSRGSAIALINMGSFADGDFADVPPYLQLPAGAAPPSSSEGGRPSTTQQSKRGGSSQSPSKSKVQSL